MDAVEFVKERNRMCSIYTPKRCEGCPADNYGGEGVACIMVDKIDADRLVPIVEAWSAAHQPKTRQSVFLEQYPNCMIDHDGVVGICPKNVDKNYICDLERFYDCYSCRCEFWSQEVW